MKSKSVKKKSIDKDLLLCWLWCIIDIKMNQGSNTFRIVDEYVSSRIEMEQPQQARNR